MSIAKFQILEAHRNERSMRVQRPRQDVSKVHDNKESLGSHTEPNAINTGVGPKSLHYPTSIYDADQS